MISTNQTRGEVVTSAAMRHVADLAYTFLLRQPGPTRMGEILAHVSQSVPVGVKALKLSLQADPRIAAEERRWTVAIPSLDSRWPIERSVHKALEWCALPVPPAAIGLMLSRAYSRTPESLSEVVARMVEERPSFFITTDGLVGLAEWLLEVTSDDEDDIIFDNFDDSTELEQLREAAQRVNWSASCLDASLELLNAAGEPVSAKVLGFYCWKHSPRNYNPLKHFCALRASGRAVLLSGARWCGDQLVAGFGAALDELERTGPDVELFPEDMPKPISVEESDLQSIHDLVAAGDTPTSVEELVESQFAVTPRDPGYEQVRSAVEKYLRSAADLMWVGWDRWQSARPIPPEVQQLPSVLEPVYLAVEGTGGQKLDQDLEDEGLEGDLAVQIRKPIVARQGTAEAQPDGTVRCEITYWVHQAGLLPTPEEGRAFPRQPEFLVVDTVDADGEVRHHWLNNNLQTLYGLGDWYKKAGLPDSGGTFLMRPLKPGTYALEVLDPKDSSTYIEPERLRDLLELRERVQQAETSTWEIVQEVMRGHSKGLPFAQLYAEVIVVRQSSPRLVASLLSGYHGFYERAGLWHFNERDASKGFKKQKRKYIIKR